MISEFTWPNHDLPSDKAAVTRLLQGCGLDHDVAYGKTKVFIRTPRTLFSLEEQRAEMVQRIVLFLQKVRFWISRELSVQLRAALSGIWYFLRPLWKDIRFLHLLCPELRPDPWCPLINLR